MDCARMWIAMALVAGLAQVAAGQQLSERDRLRIAVQEICPVSGGELGSMGDPVKVTVGEAKEEVFLCCRGCLNKKINPEHWATVHANIAKAQGKCPVMKNELPKGAKWTVVKGQIVYVCCPPCIEKIEAKPEANLRLVDSYYSAYLDSKHQAR